MNWRIVVSIGINLATVTSLSAWLWLRHGASAVPDVMPEKALVTLLVAMMIGFVGGLLSVLITRGSQASMTDVLKTVMRPILPSKQQKPPRLNAHA